MNVYRVLVSVERVNAEESDIECLDEGRLVRQFDDERAARDYALELALAGHEETTLAWMSKQLGMQLKPLSEEDRAAVKQILLSDPLLGRVQG